MQNKTLDVTLHNDSTVDFQLVSNSIDRALKDNVLSESHKEGKWI